MKTTLTLLFGIIVTTAYPIYHFGMFRNGCDSGRNKCFSIDVGSHPQCYKFSQTESYSSFEYDDTSLTYALHPRGNGCSGPQGSGRKGGRLGECNYFNYGGQYYLKLECVQLNAFDRCPESYIPCTTCVTGCGNDAGSAVTTTGNFGNVGNVGNVPRPVNTGNVPRPVNTGNVPRPVNTNFGENGKQGKKGKKGGFKNPFAYFGQKGDRLKSKFAKFGQGDRNPFTEAKTESSNIFDESTEGSTEFQYFQISNKKHSESCLDAGVKKIGMKPCNRNAKAQRFAVVNNLIVASDGNCISKNLVLGPCAPDSATTLSLGDAHNLVVDSQCIRAKTRTKLKVGRCSGTATKTKFDFVPVK